MSESAKNGAHRIWKITGADAITGKDLTITVEAASEEDAMQAAKKKGIFISDLREVPASIVSTAKSTTSGFPKYILLGIAIIAIFGITLYLFAFKFDRRKAVERDPAGQFTIFSSRYMTNLEKLIETESDKDAVWAIDNKNFQIDVEKTESLISPYIATITFERLGMAKPSEQGWTQADQTDVAAAKVNETLSFALQAGHWVLKDATYQGKMTVAGDVKEISGSDTDNEQLQQALQMTIQD